MENIKTKQKFNVRALCFTAVMAALIFVFTFTFKIPLVQATHIWATASSFYQ